MDERGTELSPVWFSATLRFASFTEDGRYFQPDVSVYTFKAVDHTSAFDRALQIGRGAERSFVNALGVRIRIALVDIETLNMLGDELDGVEVFYCPGQEHDTSPYTWDHSFTPERSTPYTAL
ncbi:DUF4288 domain-containing protein [Dactylosporangium sp. NPDC005555]|uniref:DUF4288 domain-containing protein n=1 Tax=Dactylosporangium sp. NPDC005555 TaxID=3154889 RepID=UPI0033B345BE